MGESITIKEGQTSAQFSDVKYVGVKTTDGDNAYLVPEKSVNLKTLHISKSGIYLPRDYDCYGFSKVTVSGSGASTITAGTGDMINNEPLVPGADYHLDVNPDGELEATQMPAKIKITRAPGRHIYQPGDHIDFVGLIVQAYTADDKLWKDKAHPDGVIPWKELTFPITEIDGESGDVPINQYSDGNGLNVLKIMPLEKTGSGRWWTIVYQPTIGNRPGYLESSQFQQTSPGYPPDVIYLTKRRATTQTLSGFYVYACAPELSERRRVGWSGYYKEDDKWHSFWSTASIRYIGPEWETIPDHTGWLEYIPESDSLHTLNVDDLQSIEYEIPVQWKRFGDDKVLEDSYKVTVLIVDDHSDLEGGGGSHDF